jgi:ribosomal protein L33
VSKGFDLKSKISSWGKEGTLERKKQALDKIPKFCTKCNNETIEYWDKTDEEIIFRCSMCKTFITIPYKKDKLRFYFIS